MIGYVTIGTNDIAKARAYYDALLGELGAKRMMEFGDELGGFTMWGNDWSKPRAGGDHAARQKCRDCR